MSKFKVGDKVRLKKQETYGALWKDRMVVYRLLWGLVHADHPLQGVGQFDEDELEPDGFIEGDRVEFVEDYDAGLVSAGSRGTVVRVDLADEHGPLVTIRMDSDNVVEAFAWRLAHAADAEVVAAPEVLEAPTEPQPVTYRICVGQTIGTTDYPSLEAAKEAAIRHGDDKEEFSIFEVAKVAGYRVKVEKTLEAL